jgi:uncharacterized protein YcaQ
MKLTISSARKLALSAQALSEPVSSTLEAVEHLGYVQIDTISVVERAHHHVLWSRDPEYRPGILDDLLKQRKVFEYWSHAASYLPMKEYRFYTPLMKDIATGKRKWWHDQDPKEMKKVLNRIKKEGPLQAKDFEPPSDFKSGPWFERKPAKKALDRLLMSGKLMISGRKGFQKIYDLTERVLPSGLDLTFPTPDEQGEFLVRRTLRSHGLASETEMTYLDPRVRPHVKKALKRLVQSKEITLVSIDGHSEDLYAIREDIERGMESGVKSTEERVHILSPFDNLVIQRKRLKWLFDFDYQIECYVPAEKRKFGYFCLPLLWVGPKSQIVGRIDAKAVRAERVLKIHSTFIEKELMKADKKRFKQQFLKSAEAFARFNQCDRVEFSDEN